MINVLLFSLSSLLSLFLLLQILLLLVFCAILWHHIASRDCCYTILMLPNPPLHYSSSSFEYMSNLHCWSNSPISFHLETHFGSTLVELYVCKSVCVFCCMVSGIFWYPILVSRRIIVAPWYRYDIVKILPRYHLWCHAMILVWLSCHDREYPQGEYFKAYRQQFSQTIFLWFLIYDDQKWYLQ